MRVRIRRHGAVLALAAALLMAGCTVSEVAPPAWSVVSPPEEGTRRLSAEDRRREAIRELRARPSEAASVALLKAYFPELTTDAGDAIRSAGESHALKVQLNDPATLSIETRGLTFHVERTTDNGGAGPLRREGGALLADARHFWLPAGKVLDTPQGWRATRVEEAWVVDEAEGTHRTEYVVQLPPSVTRVHNAGSYLELLGADGRPVLRFHPSEVRDADGRSRRGTIELRDATALAEAEGVFVVDGTRLKVASEVQLAALTPPLAIDPGWSSTASLSVGRTQHAMVQLHTGEILAAGGSGYILSTELFDPTTGTWSASTDMPTNWYFAISTDLPSGEVLVQMPLAGSTESAIFEPVTRTWTPLLSTLGQSLLMARNLLRTGKVLLAGGSPTDAPAFLFDPGTRTFTQTGSMSRPRLLGASALQPDGTVLVAGGHVGGTRVDTAELYDPSTGAWSVTGTSLRGRSQNALTRLRDGRVLSTAGQGGGRTSELYLAGSGGWIEAGELSADRWEHSQTLLPDGRVLVVGGGGGKLSEVFDPATAQFTPAGDIARGRTGIAAVMLPTGKVLASGGLGIGASTDVDVFDPGVVETNPTAPMSIDRPSHPIPLMLGTGKVLVVGGGFSAGVELYDPETGTWTQAAAPSSERRGHGAVLLQDGRVLLIGGNDSTGNPVTSNELYDPATDTWTVKAAMSTARADFTATVLSAGKVLVAAGRTAGGTISAAELYDPQTDSWSPAGAVPFQAFDHFAVRLPSGKVLVGGGTLGASWHTATALYDPDTNTWTAGPSMVTGRAKATATLLPSGRVLVAGGDGPNGLASTELYDPVANTWTAGGALAQPRQFLSAALLPSGLVAAVGGITGTNTQHIELYDPMLNAWSATAPIAAHRNRGASVALPDGRVLSVGGQAHARAELIEVGGSKPEWRPVVTGPDALHLGCATPIIGQRFIDASEGHSGNAFSSPANLPLVRLQANDGSGQWTLPATERTENRLVVTPPQSLTPGIYNLTVFTNALSGGRAVQLLPFTPPAAVDQALATQPGTAVSVTLGITDPQGEPVTHEVRSGPSHGTLSGTAPELVYTPAPGFSGTDTFTFDVTACGHTSAAATVTIEVGDTIAPSMSCPASFELEADSPAGATPSYPEVSASDAVTAQPDVRFDPPAGTALPVGVHAVTVTASDEAGNEATCSFDVTVRDTTAPAIACPADVSTSTGAAQGVVVTFAAPTVEDAVTPSPELTLSHPSGSTFPLGNTTVTATARDGAGNASSCTFEVTVAPEVNRYLGGGCSSGPGRPGPFSLLLVIAGLWGLRRRGTHCAAR